MTRSSEKSFKTLAMKSVYVLIAFFTIFLMSCATRSGWEYNNPYFSRPFIYFGSSSNIDDDKLIKNSNISSSVMVIKEFERGNLISHVEIETNYKESGQVTSNYKKHYHEEIKGHVFETHFYYSNTGLLEKKIDLNSEGDTSYYSIYIYDTIKKIEIQDYYDWSYNSPQDSGRLVCLRTHYIYKNRDLQDSVEYCSDEYGFRAIKRWYYDTNKQLTSAKSYDWFDTSITDVSYYNSIDQLLKAATKNKNEKVAKNIDKNENTFTYKILRGCLLGLMHRNLLIPEGKLIIKLNDLGLFTSIIAYDKKGTMTASVTRTFQNK